MSGRTGRCPRCPPSLFCPSRGLLSLPYPLGQLQISRSASKPSPVRSRKSPSPWNERPWDTPSPFLHLLSSPPAGRPDPLPPTRSLSFHPCRSSGPPLSLPMCSAFPAHRFTLLCTSYLNPSSLGLTGSLSLHVHWLLRPRPASLFSSHCSEESSWFSSSTFFFPVPTAWMNHSPSSSQLANAYRLFQTQL